MTTKELAVKLKVPENRMNTFRVKMSQMKYDILIKNVDYTMIRGRVDYSEPISDIITQRIKKWLKQPKNVYILDGEHRRAK